MEIDRKDLLSRLEPMSVRYCGRDNYHEDEELQAKEYTNVLNLGPPERH